MSAPDLNSLLSRPASEFKAPPALPAGTWEAIVGQPEFGKSSKKKTDYVRYPLTATSPTDDVDQDALQDLEFNGKKLGRGVDFYLTEDALYRLTDFLKSLGLDVENASLTELIPQAVGQPVLVSVTVAMATDGSGKEYNEVGRVVGVGA